MSHDEPYVRLPPTIELDLAEAGALLFALDDAHKLVAPGGMTATGIRNAIRLITRKLWAELGDLLDDEE